MSLSKNGMRVRFSSRCLCFGILCFGYRVSPFEVALIFSDLSSFSSVAFIYKASFEDGENVVLSLWELSTCSRSVVRSSRESTCMFCVCQIQH